MSYEIRYSDLVSVRNKIVNYANTIETQLSELGESYDAFIQSGCMTGETADTLNAYLTYVHGNLLTLIGSMIQEYVQKLMVYENGLHSIEGNRDAIIFEEELTRLSTVLSRSKKKYGTYTKDVTDTLHSVSDIYSHAAPDVTAVNDAYDKTSKIALNLQDKVGTYEHNHRNDCKDVKQYITKINQLLSSQQNNPGGTITIETIKEIVNGQPFQDLKALQDATNAFGENHKIAISKENELMKTEMEEEAARQREISGAFKVLTGVVVVGSIVLTGGAAAPAVLVLEAGAAAYGAAEITEGMQDMYYGASGNLDTKAFNPLRDTMFGGNQTAYEAFGIFTTIGCAGASQLAKQGVEITGKNLAQAAIKEGVKQIGSDMAGYGAGQVAGSFGANEGQKQFITIVTGLGVNYGLDKVDALKVKPPAISIENAGFSYSGTKLEGMAKEMNDTFRGDQFKVEDTFETSMNKFTTKKLVDANAKSTCKLNENLDGHLKTNDLSGLSEKELKRLEKLAKERANITPITEDTIMQKVIDNGALEQYMSGAKNKISGCASKASDVAPYTNNVDQAYKNLRLDYQGTAFKKLAEDQETMNVIRFKSEYCPTNADFPKVDVTQPWNQPPCTGNGVLGSEKHLIPEFSYGQGQKITEAAIFKVDFNGKETMYAIWDGTKFVEVN